MIVQAETLRRLNVHVQLMNIKSNYKIVDLKDKELKKQLELETAKKNAKFRSLRVMRSFPSVHSSHVKLDDL